MTQTSIIKKPAVRNPLDGPILAIANRIGGKKSKEVERFLKFMIVGSIGAVIDSGTLFILQATILPPTLQNPDWNVAIAESIAFIMAISSNYTWNCFWTYPDSALALLAAADDPIRLCQLNRLDWPHHLDYFGAHLAWSRPDAGGAAYYPGRAAWLSPLPHCRSQTRHNGGLVGGRGRGHALELHRQPPVDI